MVLRDRQLLRSECDEALQWGCRLSIGGDLRRLLPGKRGMARRQDVHAALQLLGANVRRVLAQKSYNELMAHDEYHEALLERVRALQDEIAGLCQREAYSYAYLISQEIPEEGARMLVAEMLLDYWARAKRRARMADTLG